MKLTDVLWDEAFYDYVRSKFAVCAVIKQGD